ncbi:MAG: aldehyde dehydrogenase family protein [Gemmatimonadaceae bacterium]
MSAKTVASVDPATGDVWAEWPAASRDDVTVAVARARGAQPAWAGTPIGMPRASWSAARDSSSLRARSSRRTSPSGESG